MRKGKILVVGLGEVGRPIFELIKESGNFEVHGIDVDDKKMAVLGQKTNSLPIKVDVMHVCIPCANREKFIETVSSYAGRFKPALTIINSTVPPGTTMAIHARCKCAIAHSPIRGVHTNLENMKWEIKRWKKYVGGVDEPSGLAARKHFESIGLSTEVLKGSTETELAKLFETTYRAWMIACFQEMHRISRYVEADFDDVLSFLDDTHRVRLDRPIMFPDVISRHCLIPNVKLLLEVYDSEFLRLILRSNSERQKEIKNREIMNDVEKVKKRAVALQKAVMKQRA